MSSPNASASPARARPIRSVVTTPSSLHLLPPVPPTPALVLTPPEPRTGRSPRAQSAGGPGSAHVTGERRSRGTSRRKEHPRPGSTDSVRKHSRRAGDSRRAQTAAEDRARMGSRADLRGVLHGGAGRAGGDNSAAPDAAGPPRRVAGHAVDGERL